MKKLTIYVRYIAKKGYGEKFLKEVIENSILEKIRKEEGCIRYDYFISLENRDEILLLELWENENFQKEHMKQDHMKNLKLIKDKYILDTRVEKI